MSNKASQKLLEKKKQIDRAIPAYVKSKAFEAVAKKAMEDFVKRVKRGLMPDLAKIPALGSPEYIALRKKYSSNLGKLAKATKSNATATGQMLDAITYEMTQQGFIIFVADSARSGELSGADSKLSNAEVAAYYSQKRNIFDFSKPELSRIIRTIKTDLVKIINLSK